MTWCQVFLQHFTFTFTFLSKNGKSLVCSKNRLHEVHCQCDCIVYTVCLLLLTTPLPPPPLLFVISETVIWSEFGFCMLCGWIAVACRHAYIIVKYVTVNAFSLLVSCTATAAATTTTTTTLLLLLLQLFFTSFIFVYVFINVSCAENKINHLIW